MQNKSQPYFKDRSIFYSSYAIAKQGEPGDEWKYNLKAVYTVCFLNFRRPDISTEFRTDVALMDMRHNTLFSNKLRLIYLQLPLFQKEPEECTTIFEQMIYTLKNMDILQRRPDLFQGPVFSKIASIADVASLTKEERERYDISLRQYRDTMAVLEGQYLEGMKKEKVETVYRLKQLGLTVEQIAQGVGMTKEEVSAML